MNYKNVEDAIAADDHLAIYYMTLKDMAVSEDEIDILLNYYDYASLSSLSKDELRLVYQIVKNLRPRVKSTNTRVMALIADLMIRVHEEYNEMWGNNILPTNTNPIIK